MLDRAGYERYLAAFNAKDYDGVADFYVDPPHMEFFGIVITSREELKAFYGWLHSCVKESVSIHNFAASDTATAVDAIVRIEALRDLTREELDAKGATGFFPIQAGQVQEIRQFIFYTTRDGRIEKVECALPPPLAA
ncbi:MULTISPECIES: nuclear transport factor 2 family protein [unclassified Novosphingobium]|uniref:nuclear transport factor 2 family protein n=1 Tax=unclassified Novosphingobium TaxID=2644732 RepID=UPI001469BBE3|nr:MULTISPECIES: nuclear transport factor 2 family protein [unclassified Novosphingobium]NMN06919.1 ketosteroid isomerase-like protein [Novosphingobium sp. SG919]NMN89494.1 ketosteroid isomerase-like protein [Novosphingobium sp. SG916]